MRNERGSLLIELLVGTVILAGSLFAVFLGLVTLSDELSVNRQRAAATTLAANTLAIIRAERYEALTIGQTIVPISALPSGRVLTTMSQPQPDVYDVVVTVEWSDGAHARSVQLVTKVANDGLESL